MYSYCFVYPWCYVHLLLYLCILTFIHVPFWVFCFSVFFSVLFVRQCVNPTAVRKYIISWNSSSSVSWRKQMAKSILRKTLQLFPFFIIEVYSNTECPTRYRTRHFFNNSSTNEDIATKFEQEYVRCVRNEEKCVCSEPNCCDTVKLLKKCRVL